MKNTAVRTLSLFLVVCALVFPSHLRSQGVTSSAITGLVTDEAGNPVAGARITAVDESSGTAYNSITRETGRYDLANVRTGGPYRITATADGRSRSRGNVFTTLSQTAEANLTLPATAAPEAAPAPVIAAEDAAQTERVVVQGTAVDDLYSPGRTGASTYVTRQEIDALPSIARSIQDYVRLTPQISTTGRLGPSAAGQNNRFNNLQIDGATTSDAFGLAGSGLPTEGAEPISLDTIDQFRVNIAPYDVRESNFTGASINAITRSGTNNWDGSIYGFGRDQRLVGDSSRNQPVAAFHEYQLGGRLSGPIVKDKLFFFVNYEIKRAVFPILGDTSRFNLAGVQQIIDITTNQYGFDPGSIGDETQTVWDDKFFAKLDWNIFDNQRLSVRYNHVDGFNQFGLSRGSTYDLESRQYDRPIETNSLVLQLFSTWAPGLSTEARVSYNTFTAARVPGGPFPAVTVAETFGDVRFGSEQFSQKNELDQEIMEGTFNADYFIGNHQITVGTNNELFAFKNLFLRDFFGTYTFRASPGFTATQNYQRGAPTNYAATFATEPGAVPVTEFRYYNVSAYVQDQWTVLPNLRFTIGVRTDNQIFPDDPLFNPKFAADFPGRNTSEIPSGNFLFSPRLGFNWDVFNNKQTQLRGGTGVFTGRTLGVFLSNQYGGTGMDFQRTSQTFGGRNQPPLTPGFFEEDPNNPPRVGSVIAPEIDITDPEFQFPQIARSSLAIDQKLVFGVIATLEGLYAKNLNALTFRNLNLGAQTGTRAEDGRPIYAGNRANRDFDRVILLTNTSQGYSYNLTAQLERPNGGDGLYAKLAYTYGTSRDINSNTSSQAASNYQFNPTSGNPNVDELSTSDFQLRHRILGVISYTYAFRKGWDSTLGIFYEGRSGSPYSVLYSGDVNGDGEFSNDLIYVPTGLDDPIRAKFVTPANFAEYNNYIENNEFLKDHRGRIAPRNGGRDPWINKMDLHFSQKIPIKMIDLEFTVDVLNFTNLIDDSRGQIKRYSSFGTPQPVTYNTATDRYTFDPRRGTVPTVQSFDDLESRWRVQFGFRASF
ncbi:TonB-dependent receptor [soil metagenome]